MSTVHGGDIYEGPQIQLDFSVNTGPFGMPQKVRQAAVEAVQMADAYPDPKCRRLKEKLAVFHGLLSSHFAVGNGAADLIYSLVWALKPGRALLIKPSFSEYQSALLAAGCQVDTWLLSREQDFVLLPDFVAQLQDYDMVFLCNPNNPTGRLIQRPLMMEIVKACENHGICLVVDECFMDFVEESKGYSLATETSRYPCLVVLKAFTKLYAMAGLRLGYCISQNREWMRKLEQVRQPWSVSLVAEQAGLMALEEQDFVKRTREEVKTQRPILAEGLEALGFMVFPSDTNFLLFAGPKNLDLKACLLQKGILIRSCGNFDGLLPQDYRVCVKGGGDNQILLQALEEVMAKWQKS